MLSKNEFTILSTIEREKEIDSQRDIVLKSGLSLGTVNKVFNELTTSGFIDSFKITEMGLEALEPYRVKRAIFLAAGFGSRLIPISINTPKPLIKVHGKRMIETLLDAVIAVGITEIYIVRGYLAEQFDILLHKYPTIKFIDNPLYNEGNNIGSALACKDLFENSYVFEADLVLSKPSLITKYQYECNYLGIKVEKSDDWCLILKNGKITDFRIGGENCYQYIGISYFNSEAGKKLALDIPVTFNKPGGKELFWDAVPLLECAKHYVVGIRPCLETDVVEIDSFKELKAIDKSYDC